MEQQAEQRVAHERCPECCAGTYLGNCGTKHAPWLRFLSAASSRALGTPRLYVLSYSVREHKYQYLEKVFEVLY